MAASYFQSKDANAMNASSNEKPPERLAEAAQRLLRILVGMMIPAGDEHGIPGADDAAIFADIVGTLGRDLKPVRAALHKLEDCAAAVSPEGFEAMPAQQRWQAIQAFRDAHAADAAVLVEVTVRCYYRDDRVMRSIGMQARAPFPAGFEVDPGDLALLEPVRARGAIYRRID
jgi:hypothetical protein